VFIFGSGEVNEGIDVSGRFVVVGSIYESPVEVVVDRARLESSERGEAAG
jgi:hypothetical protein